MRRSKRFLIPALGGGLLLAGALALQAAAEPGAPDAAAARQDSCTTATPPLPAGFDPGSSQPWSVVGGFLADSLVFDLGGSFGAPVRLCESCRVLTLRIQSEVRAPCVAEDSLNGQPRVVGLMRKLSQSRNEFESLIGFGPDNADGVVYLVATDSTEGYGLYRSVSDSTRIVSGLFFHFCADGGEPGKVPNARWVPTTCVVPSDSNEVAAGAMHARRARGGGPEADAQTELADGWMSCLSGCCRFYGPPPGEGALIERDEEGRPILIRLRNGRLVTPRDSTHGPPSPPPPDR